MSVLIAGAGIGGLTLALSLHSVGIKTQVFEAVREIRPLGLGINLQPHAIREFEALGLLPQLDKIGLRTKEVCYFSSHGQKIWSEPRGKYAGYNWPQFSIHRGKIQMLLLAEVRKRLGNDAVITGAAVEQWHETARGIEIHLSDRATGNATSKLHGDVLIGADGIHSTVRSFYYPDEGPPVWGGIVMWRGVTKGAPYLNGRTIVMAGCKQRKFVV
ncbi:MAG: FAD-dependent monooxygenase, partial [Rhizobiaceae bacterium]|nr:FAD-dependent monooxygenase [Rhizobiaceae bacterium]